MNMNCAILNPTHEGLKAERRFGSELNDRCRAHNYSNSKIVTPYRIGVEPSEDRYRVHSLELDHTQLNKFLDTRMDLAYKSNKKKRLELSQNMWDYMIDGVLPGGGKVIIDVKWTSHGGNPKDPDSRPSFCHPIGEILTAKRLINPLDEWWIVTFVHGRVPIWMGEMNGCEWLGEDKPKSGGLGHRVVDMENPMFIYKNQKFDWYPNLRQAIDHLIRYRG